MATQDSKAHPMKPLCEEWLKKIKIGKEVKEERFGKYAREAANFYDGPHDWMWKSEYARGQGGFLDKSNSNAYMPSFRMTVNRVFEAVALFGPALYHQYPNVTVTRVKAPEIDPMALGYHLLGANLEDPSLDPMTAQMAFQQQQQWAMIQEKRAYEEALKESCANVKEHILNWLQVETNKKQESRRSIVECIVKGAGYLYTEIHQPRGSLRKYPRSRHISCDDVIKDPDACYGEDVQWISIEHTHPVNYVAAKFGLKAKDLAGHFQSYNSQGTPLSRKQARANKKSKGESFDLIRYYEIYSKNGFGSRLKSTDKQSTKSKIDYEQFGDFCYIVVAEGVPFPLNMPTWSLSEPPEGLFMRSQWPVPFWTDEGCGNGWPLAELGFYEKPGSVWPISLIKPAIGEIRFVNWCMSFLADKVAAACVDYVAVLKEAGMEIQDQIKNKMAPYTVLEISQITGKNINEVVSFLEAPSFSQDIWKMVAEVLEMIDKRTGLTELIFGLTGTQIRSAQEASIREQNINIRPDDMANKTEEWLSESAMKEIEAAVWGCDGKDFFGPLGQDGALYWDQYIRTQDFEVIVRDYKYRIEAGSARKPNKANRLRSLAEFSQSAMPTIENMAAQGIVNPWNALMKDYGEAMDIDPSPYLIELPEAQGPNPEEIKAELEMKKMELEMEIKEREFELKEREMEMKLQFMKEEHELEMKQKKEEHKLDTELQKEKTKMEAQAMKADVKLKKETAQEMSKVKIEEAKAKAAAQKKAASQSQTKKKGQ